MKKKGAEIFIDALVKEGVEVMFGITGGCCNTLFDALYDAPIKFILTRHEQGPHMRWMDTHVPLERLEFAWLLLVPGATNLTTGIATAYGFYTNGCNYRSGCYKSIGNDAFQEADTTGITRPITKHNYLVKDVKD